MPRDDGLRKRKNEDAGSSYNKKPRQNEPLPMGGPVSVHVDVNSLHIV